MIDALMKIPDIVLEEATKEGWSLTVGRFEARFEPREELAWILLIKLNDITLPLTLVEQWQRQLSSGDYANNLALVVMDECWWLAQYFDENVDIANEIHLQIQLAECMHILARAENHADVRP